MYYLTVIKHPRLLNFLFQAQASYAETFIKDLLSKILTKVDKYIYRLNPENIIYLDKVLGDFKNEFFSFLKSAPPPFSFILTKAQGKKFPNIVLRAGKIYLEENLKNEINSILKDKKTFYKLEPWQTFWELILPSTVDPKIELFYKDLFWSGEKKPCFFCKTPWHESLNCPALSDVEPRSTFQSALNLTFRDLSQILWDGIGKENFSYEKLKYLYIRNFYLFPEFLKIIFYRYENIETWGHFRLDMEAPVRGGNLGLGLEYLIKRNLESAKKEFLEVGDDFRASIGLALISILKDDSKNTLYYIEKALSQVKTPFLSSYLLLLKGYFYEYIGESAIAEEFYRDALEKDLTCFPAFYYYNLTKYQKGTSLSEILTYFNHPYLLYWGYLEPVFIKDQRELEEILYDKIAEKRELASQRLKDTEDRYHKVKIFLSESEIKEYEERLTKIREDVYKGGLGLIENAYQRALEMDLELQGYIYRLVKNLKNEFEKIKTIYKNIVSFWKKYPYKYEAPNFGKELKELFELIQKIDYKLKRKDPSDALTSLISEIESCKKLTERLNVIKNDLVKKWNFRIKLANFLKTFSIYEFLIVSLYIIFPYLPISENIKSFFNLFSFLFISFVLLIISLLTSYFKDYELE